MDPFISQLDVAHNLERPPLYSRCKKDTSEIRRRKAIAAEPGSFENDSLLPWIINFATQNEGDPASVSHLEVVMSLTSIHTSQMNAVHCLYDLIARPVIMVLNLCQSHNLIHISR